MVDKLELAHINAIMDGIAAAVIAVNAKNRLVYCNEAAMALFDLQGEVIGSDVHVIHHNAILDLLEQDSEARAEIIFDDELTLNAHMTLVPSIGKVVVMQDISHLKQLDRLKTNFVANISRDLRSPLTAILGYAELLNSVGKVNEQQSLFIDRITIAAQSISSLITDLLELSRIETGSVEHSLDIINLGAVVRYALATVEGQMKDKNHKLVVGIDDSGLQIQGSGQRLKQMVRNLLQNAIMYTPDGGTIAVVLQYEDDVAVLAISDTGIGVSLEDQQHIFDEFYRSEQVVGKYEGSGLGLAIVKSIVEQHRGMVWVESSPGDGSTFTVILPTMQQVEIDEAFASLSRLSRSVT